MSFIIRHGWRYESESDSVDLDQHYHLDTMIVRSWSATGRANRRLRALNAAFHDDRGDIVAEARYREALTAWSRVFDARHIQVGDETWTVAV